MSLSVGMHVGIGWFFCITSEAIILSTNTDHLSPAAHACGDKTGLTAHIHVLSAYLWLTISAMIESTWHTSY